MKLLRRIGERLQATFPPNRIMLGLAGPITAASVWFSAWVTANVPGVALPVGVIAGAMGLVGLIVVTLLYKWFDQWTKGEPIHVDADLEGALDQLEADSALHGAFFEALGTFDGVGKMLEELRQRIAAGTLHGDDVDQEIATILLVIDGFLQDHGEPPEPADSAATGVTVAAQPAAPPAEPAQ